MIWTALKGKRVLFVTTKNLDYIRNTQEIRILNQNGAVVTVIGSYKRTYTGRLFQVWSKLLLIAPNSFDVVFWGFSPQLTLPFFHWKFRKQLHIEDFFISLFDTCCCDRSYFSSHSVAGRLLHFLDKYTLRAASRIICDTNSHGSYFSEEFQIAPENFETLYLEADSSIYVPEECACGEKSRCSVLYFGNMLPLQGIETIVSVCELLQNATCLSFTIIGPLPEEFRKRLKNFSNTVLIPYLPQKDLAKAINKADICLAGHFHPTIGKAARTIPGKAFIYRAMHKPMILGDSPANNELFSENMPGIYYVPRGNPQKLAELLLNLAQKVIMKQSI